MYWGRDRVEELAAHREPELEHLQQQPTSHPQARVDVTGAIQVRVVDQPLPAGGGAGLLEVDPHRDAQLGAQPLGLAAQSLGVVVHGLDVVHAARADNRQQAIVQAVKDGMDLRPPLQDHPRLVLPERQLLQQRERRAQRLDSLDPLVAELIGSRDANRQATTPIGSVRVLPATTAAALTRST